MAKTAYKIENGEFYINGKLTYSEIPHGNPKVQGLLFNARFINGVFDDANPDNAGKYDRFGRKFDRDRNTDELIRALPAWYDAGLRAITVGLQAGGPIYTYEDWGCIRTNAFTPDGRQMNEDTWNRLVRIIAAADELGMLVIVSFFYQAQIQYLEHDGAVIEASKTACRALRKLPYDNIILEIANEYNILDAHVKDTALTKGKNMAAWIGKVREWTDARFAVGSSAGGIYADREVILESDLSLVHGNAARRQELHDFVRRVRSWKPEQPIVVNEDSPLFTHLEVAVEDHFSWGYYNNMTKQEPPCDWGITRGEDEFFARRLSGLIGICRQEPENEFYLQGFEPEMTIAGGRYVRVAASRPELIDRVRFYEDGVLLDVAYAEPFMLNSKATWIQEPYFPSEGAEEFRAEVVLFDGRVEILNRNLKDL